MRKSLNYTPLLLLTLLWGFTIVHFTDLPETLPIHFNAFGKPDNFGPRNNAFGLPLLASALYGILSFAYRRKEVKKEEKKMLLWIQGGIMLTFGYIQFQSFSVALHRSDGLGVWFLPISGGIIILPILLNLMKKK